MVVAGRRSQNCLSSAALHGSNETHHGQRSAAAATATAVAVSDHLRRGKSIWKATLPANTVAHCSTAGVTDGWCISELWNVIVTHASPAFVDTPCLHLLGDTDIIENRCRSADASHSSVFSFVPAGSSCSVIPMRALPVGGSAVGGPSTASS